MHEILPFLLPVGFFALIIALISYGFYAARKRRELIAAVAPRMGFSYSEKDNGFRDTHSKLKMFSRGHSHQIINVLSGVRDEITVIVADYHYTTGSGKNSTHHSQTICVISDPSIMLPHFYLRQENKFFDYLGKLFGGQDINFSEDPAFSSAFVLQGFAETPTRELFSSEVRKVFMRFANSGTQVEGQDNSLVIHRGTILEPEKFPSLMKDAFDIYHTLKSRESGL